MISELITTPSLTAEHRTLTAEQFGRLTTAGQAKFKALLELMGKISRARKVWPAIVALTPGYEARLKLSAQRIRTLYYAWVKEGELALVDHNLCGGKCRLPGCSHRVSNTIPSETIEAWLELVENNDRAAFRHAWKLLIEKLAKGEPIQGLGTWRTLYAQENPQKALPEKCPWSIHRPPFGWSYQSFLNKRPPEFETILGKKGWWHAKNSIASVVPVRTDISMVPFMGIVVFDDARLDFKVWVGKQIVELWGVFAMDVATRTILAWGVRPRLESDDGTKQSITRRDIQHLIASLLSTHGFPIAYECRFLVENASAAITPEVEKMLTRVTNGQVVVDRTSIMDARSLGFQERSGNPRGTKGRLESYFALLHTQLGDIKGQIGNRWENQAGDFAGRQNIGVKLARLNLMETLPDQARPFVDLDQARAFIHDGILRTENREIHDLQFFDDVRLWRESEHDVWKPCDSGLFPELPMDVQNRFMGSPLTGLLRKETPAERRAKLFHAEHFQALSPAAKAFFFLDHAVIPKYKGGDTLIHAFCGRTYDWFGLLHPVRIGQKLIVRFDADRPFDCVVEDELGRTVGAMRNRRAPSYYEREALVERLGERQKAIGKALHNVRTRHASREDFEALDQAVHIINAALPKAGVVAHTDALTERAVERYAEASAEPDVSSAEAYLANQQPGVRSEAAQPRSEPVDELEVSIEEPAEEDFTPSW